MIWGWLFGIGCICLALGAGLLAYERGQRIRHLEFFHAVWRLMAIHPDWSLSQIADQLEKEPPVSRGRG